MTSDQLTLFAEDFPAPIFPSLVRDSASPDPRAAYGRSTPELLARYDPDTSSWRMLRPCLFGEWDEFSGIFPPSGMTRNGELYLLPMSEPRICGDGSGLLPTPSATSYGTNHGGGMGRMGPVRPSLETMARKNLWPTPRAIDGRPKGNGPRPDTLTGSINYNAEGLRIGSLNPTWVAWLMGYPAEWTDLEASAMQSYPKLRRSSAKQSSRKRGS